MVPNLSGFVTEGALTGGISPVASSRSLCMSVKVAKELSTALKRTPLHALHLALGALMAPFAGYDMPLNYAAGVLKEHSHTRSATSLFDVSHMGQMLLRSKSSSSADAAHALERLVSADVLGLAPDRQRYTFFTNDAGGILDDLIVAKRGDHYLLVVNAACKEKDEALLRDALSADCDIELTDRALIALQGPKAEAALAHLAPDCARLRFMDVHEITIMGTSCVVSRSGYTGEDGFEISTPPDVAREIAEGLLENPDVAPAGLAARDTLRLEAGLCLYGADLNETTTPVMAGLSWAISPARRQNGQRAGGFPGAAVILNELDRGTQAHRVGLAPEGRAPVRGGAPLFAQEVGGAPIGHVTSGGFGPSLDRPIAMGYVPTTLSKPGKNLFAEVRDTRLTIAVTPLPFIEHRYKKRVSPQGGNVAEIHQRS
jgi:aminomethyltransferase